VVFAIGARLPDPAGPKLAGVEVAFVSLFAESLPFLLAGGLIAALLSATLGPRVMQAAGAHPRLAAAFAPVTGLGLPLCDCGMLPLARELRNEGAGRAVNSFIAGAPIVNPIVIISTLVAFPGSPEVAAGRTLAGLAVAMAAGAVASPPPAGAVHAHDHHGDDDERLIPRLLGAVGFELERSAPALVIGALLAATVKAFVPTSTFTAISAQPLLAALAMMALAFILSICSQADAFVAASLPVGAMPRLAFLVMGPALDLRLSVLYRREFGGAWVAGYAAVIVPMVILATTACAVVGLL
jgi:uncharacterized membrane protein YraQ (UPF0718 family)